MGRVPVYDVTFSSTRYVSFERVTRNRVHRHSFFEPCIVISGSGEFEHGSAKRALREGDLFIADPGVYHEIRSPRTKDLKLYFLAFNVTRTEGGVPGRHPSWISQSALARFVLDHSNHLPSQSHVIPLFEHVMTLGRQDATDQRSRFHREATLLLLSEIVAALTDSAAVPSEEHSDRLLRKMVVEAIERRLHRPLRVASLAADCHLSERTLRRRWKSCARRSLTQEIKRRRIERARHLLLFPDISTAEVGYQVGVESPAQFSRMFKSLTGLAPTAYRKKYRSEPAAGRCAGAPFRTEFLDGDTREYLR